MGTLSVAVMAHPVREQQVVELIDQLGEQVPVQWDLAGPPSSDPERRWANGRAAWERIDLSADWGMVLQDDLVVAPDLLPALTEGLEHVPERVIVQPYVGTKRPDPQAIGQVVAHAEHVGASWIDMRSMKWGPAICVPTGVIRHMLVWCSEPPRAGMAYDKRIGVYFRRRLGWRCWYPWPSLVDHRWGPSICGNAANHSGDVGERVAHRMISGSALGWDPAGLVLRDDTPTPPGMVTAGNMRGMGHDPFRPQRPHRVPARHALQGVTHPHDPLPDPIAPAGDVTEPAASAGDDGGQLGLDRPTGRDSVATWRTYLASLGIPADGNKKTLMDRLKTHEQEAASVG